MAHKFADKWQSRLFINKRWQDNGMMDLSKMNLDGNLTEGSHQHSSSTYDLDGHAAESKYIELHSSDPIEVYYYGTLTHESGGNMIIAGRKHYVDENLARKVEEGQDDPPWIIIK